MAVTLAEIRWQIDSRARGSRSAAREALSPAIALVRAPAIVAWGVLEADPATELEAEVWVAVPVVVVARIALEVAISLAAARAIAVHSVEARIDSRDQALAPVAHVEAHAHAPSVVVVVVAVVVEDSVAVVAAAAAVAGVAVADGRQ